MINLASTHHHLWATERALHDMPTTSLPRRRRQAFLRVIVALTSLLGICAHADDAPERLSVAVDIKLDTDTPAFRRLVDDFKQLITLKFQDELAKNIRANLELEQQKSSPLLTDKRVQQLIDKGHADIETAMQPFGFYNPTIEHSAHKTGMKWQVAYRVTPGTPTIVQATNISIVGDGAQDDDIVKQRKQFPLRDGQVLQHRFYETGKRDLLRRALLRGYLDAHFTESRVEVERQRNRATIILTLETGPRYRFGPIHFAETVLEEDYLFRHVPFKQGDPYSTESLVTLQNNLYNSDYFSGVEVDSRRDLADDREIPIDVRLTPRERFRYTAGIGYSTDIGPRESLGWTHRRINSRGDHLKTDLRVSPVRDSFSARYGIPLRSARSDEVDLTFSWVDESQNGKDDETFLYGISRTRERRSAWLETIYLNYQTDHYRIDGQSDDTQFLIPGVVYSHTDADNFTNTWDGHRVSLDVHAANTALISDGSFTQTLLSAKWIHRIYGPTRVVLRGDAGATFFGDTQKLPPSLRFFAGGDQSVRGFAYKSLSPDNLGGEQLLVGSAEFEWRYAPNWGAAVFTDAGNAMNSWTTPLEHSAGIGLRWISPIGPVRLDRAWQLTAFEGKEQMWILVIGPEL